MPPILVLSFPLTNAAPGALKAARLLVLLPVLGHVKARAGFPAVELVVTMDGGAGELLKQISGEGVERSLLFCRPSVLRCRHICCHPPNVADTNAVAVVVS